MQFSGCIDDRKISRQGKKIKWKNAVFDRTGQTGGRRYRRQTFKQGAVAQITTPGRNECKYEPGSWI